MRALLGAAVLVSVIASYLSSRRVRFEDVPRVPFQPAGLAFGTIWAAIYLLLLGVGVENVAGRGGGEKGEKVEKGEGELSLLLLVLSLLLTTGWAACAARRAYRLALSFLLLSALLAWASLATRSLSFPSSSPWSDAGVGLFAGWLSAACLLASFLAFPPGEGGKRAGLSLLLTVGGTVGGSVALREPWPCAALAWGAFWQRRH